MNDGISISGRQARVKLAKVLDEAGYDREKFLKALKFPLILSGSVNGSFDELIFDDVTYRNLGSGVAINAVTKRDIKSIKMQRFKETKADIMFSSDDTPIQTSLIESDEDEEDYSKRQKYVLMNFYTRGDMEQIAFDKGFEQGVYLSNNANAVDWDDDPIFQLQERPSDLIRLKYPTFSSFPYRIKICYTLGKWIEYFHGGGTDPNYITDETAYIDGQITFVDFETFEPVLTIGFHLHKSGWWESDKTYDTIVLRYDDISRNYVIESQNTYPGGGISEMKNSWVASTFHQANFFDKPKKTEDEKNITLKDVDIVYPQGWTYPFED